MKVFEAQETRAEYFQAQITHADRKFRYSKVSTQDVRKYYHIITRDKAARQDASAIGPIVCLGVRNGREVDLFRVQFFGLRMLRRGVEWCERQIHPFVYAGLSVLESSGRSCVGLLTPQSVWGVEINPRAARPDVWIGPFDNMPAAWGGKFGVVFSDSLDHAQDPEKTAKEWKRVARPSAYCILCLSHDHEPTVYGRVADISLTDVVDLFGGRLVYFHRRGSQSGFSEVILQW